MISGVGNIHGLLVGTLFLLLPMLLLINFMYVVMMSPDMYYNL